MQQQWEAGEELQAGVSGSKPESRATRSRSLEGLGTKLQPSKSLSYGYPGKKLGPK